MSEYAVDLIKTTNWKKKTFINDLRRNGTYLRISIEILVHDLFQKTITEPIK